MATTIALIVTQFNVAAWDVRGDVQRDVQLTSFFGGKWGACLQLTVGPSFVPLTRAEVEALRTVCDLWLSGAPREEIARQFNGETQTDFLASDSHDYKDAFDKATRAWASERASRNANAGPFEDSFSRVMTTVNTMRHAYGLPMFKTEAELIGPGEIV